MYYIRFDELRANPSKVFNYLGMSCPSFDELLGISKGHHHQVRQVPKINISGRKADNKYSCGKTSKIERTASNRHHPSVNTRNLNQCPNFPMSNVMKFRAYETRKASDVASRLRPGWEDENRASGGFFASEEACHSSNLIKCISALQGDCLPGRSLIV